MEIDKVWVLNVRKDEQNFPEVHTSFEGAVAAVLDDIHEHEVEGDDYEYDYDSIRSEVEKFAFYIDDTTDTEYDIVQCPVVE